MIYTLINISHMKQLACELLKSNEHVYIYVYIGVLHSSKFT